MSHLSRVFIKRFFSFKQQSRAFMDTEFVMLHLPLLTVFSVLLISVPFKVDFYFSAVLIIN